MTAVHAKADGGPLCAINETTGTVVASHVDEARSFWRRLVGLTFRKSLPPGYGLLLRPCNAIHTCFMRVAIDAVYLAPDGRVLRVDRNLRPWKVARPCRGAVAVLELSAGSGDALDAGHTLRIEPATRTGKESEDGLDAATHPHKRAPSRSGPRAEASARNACSGMLCLGAEDGQEGLQAGRLLQRTGDRSREGRKGARTN